MRRHLTENRASHLRRPASRTYFTPPIFRHPREGGARVDNGTLFASKATAKKSNMFHQSQTIPFSRVHQSRYTDNCHASAADQSPRSSPPALFICLRGSLRTFQMLSRCQASIPLLNPNREDYSIFLRGAGFWEKAPLNAGSK